MQCGEKVIRRIYRFDGEHSLDGYYGGKIKAAAESYGFSYDFCRFYSYDGGYILIYNSSSIMTGIFKNGELSEFLDFCGAYSLECPKGDAPEGFEAYPRTMLTFPVMPYEYEKNELTVNSGFGRIYEITQSSFGDIDRDLWYADISHRVRHGISTTFLYKNCASGRIDFVSENCGYIADIAVSPESRHKGTGGELLKVIGNHLFRMGLCGKLYAYNDVLPFYLHGGACVESSDVYYRRKEI